MTWDEFKADEIVEGIPFGQIPTNIECPECGKKIFWNSTITLTTYPPQYSYWCKCGWHGTSYKGPKVIQYPQVDGITPSVI